MSTRPSLTLSATLPMKPSQTITSTLPRVDVAAFDVADEVEVAGSSAAAGGARELVALVLLLADREDADARIGTVRRMLRE